MLDPKIRDDYWRELSSLVYEISPGDAGRDVGFRGTVSSRPFGRMTVGITTFNSQKCSRSRQLVARSGLGLCVVQLVLEGEARGNFNGADVALVPGDILIHDLTQVMDAQVTTGARMAIAVDRADIERLVSRRRLHGLVLKGRSPPTRLLTHYMMGLDDVLTELPDDAIAASEEAFLILLANAINGPDGGGYEDAPINLPMRHRIISFIDSRLGDPRLDAQLILKHFGLSRSHLYRTFEPDGGVASFIRDRRLDLAYRLLRDRNTRSLSNKEILSRCGLPDHIHFSSAFKERFGVKPTEARDIGEMLQQPRRTAPQFHTYLGDYIRKAADAPG